MNGARFVIDDGGETHRPSAPRMLNAQLHAAESIRILFGTSAECAMINKRSTRFGEGEDGGRLTATPPGCADAQAAGETRDEAARLCGA